MCLLGRTLLVVGFVEFIRALPGGRRVHPCSLGSLGRALEVVGFIRVRNVHYGAPWGSLGSFGLVGFIQARHRRGRIHSGSLGSFGRAHGVVRFIRIHSGLFGFIRACPGLGSLGSLRRALGVLGFLLARPGDRWVYSGTPNGSSGYFGFTSFGSYWFIPVRLGEPWL